MRQKGPSRRSLPVLAAAPPPAPVQDGWGGPTAVRVGVVTLGCDKNTVDSERTMARLLGAGARVSAEVDGADVVVVNTCGFIEAAKEESIETILEAARLKADGRTRAVVAMGCLVQRYKAELEAELPEVDLFLNLAEAARLVPELRARGLIPAPDAVPAMERPLRILSSEIPHASHLKISEGCDHGCAFCAIPLMRGKHRSTPVDVLVREAQELEARGVVELNIVSQDTTWYGRDLVRGGAAAGDGDDGYFLGKPFAGMAGMESLALAPAPALAKKRPHAQAQANSGPRHGLLPDLLTCLLSETSIPWFRLFYMYPSGIRRELVELIAREDRILPYLDMPIQHGADSMLERMRRPERQAVIRERVGWLREAIPELVLRTTVIVGFPGETEDEFEALLDLLEEIGFDRLGAFTYSHEEGTRAATLPDPVPESVKRERLERLLEVQRSISLERNEARVGRATTVLVDRPAAADEEGVWVGRTPGQAREVDGVVFLDGAAEASPGEFVRARITGANEFDLRGEILVGEP